MKTALIIGAIISIILYILYLFIKNSNEVEITITKETPKFEPRKVVDLSKGEIGTDPIPAPKKKYYKKKKKKPSVSTPVEKKPVGRPKKS